MGYAYAVSKSGLVVSEVMDYHGGRPNQQSEYGIHARLAHQPASISKAVTGSRSKRYSSVPAITLDMPFWPLIQSMVPNPDPSVEGVTFAISPP